MIDISNKTDVEINALIQHYTPVLELVRDKQQIPYFAVIIHIGTEYIQNKYSDLGRDWKTWAIVVVKDLFKYIKNEVDVERIIDEFVLHYKTNYQQYANTMLDISSASEYDRDLSFVQNYIMNMKVW